MINLIWWLLLAAALAMTVTWGALHGLIVPRISELRPQLEKQLSQSLGVPVRIESISAQSNGVVPSFELRNVQLLDSAGRTALLLQRVFATLSPRSVLQLGFEQLVLEQPSLDIRRDKQGRIFVAGLDFSQSKQAESDQSMAADWFFSQREFVIRGGAVRWTDELRNAPELALTEVDLVVRNPGRQHLVQLHASPSVAWGDRFSIQGELRSPLLGANAGDWQKWQGALFAQFSRVDMLQLKHHANVGLDINQGHGSLRAWAELNQGQITAVTADIALADVGVRLAPQLQPLALRTIKGRLSARRQDQKFEFATQNLAFTTQEGVQWSGGNITLSQTEPGENKPVAGQLQADQLDLATLALIVDRLPVSTTTHSLINSLKPQGIVQQLRASWTGPLDTPQSYEVSTKISGLAFSANAAAHRPGLRGGSIDATFNQSGGQAQLTIEKGLVELPGAFEDPVIALDTLQTQAKWTLQGKHIALTLNGLKFANADTQVEAQMQWRTSDPTKSASKSYFPGVLDLQGTVVRANGARVYRYLPLTILKEARYYVRDAITQGSASAGKFKIKGDLFDLPFLDPKQGEFHISTQVKNANFAYVPSSLLAKGSLPWPELRGINGELVFDRASLSVLNASGRIGNLGNLQFSQAQATIADLYNSPTVVVSVDSKGPASEVLTLVNGSPLTELTSKSLAQANATGIADLRLRLNLPIFALQRSKVLGSLTLANNDIQITPNTPILSRARGVIVFTENGFNLRDAQARMLGGEMRLEGGTRSPSQVSGSLNSEASLVFRAQGSITAEGLRQANELGFASRLAHNASGNAAYSASLAFRRGIPELSISSNLQGMALNLPAPLNKSAESVLPFKLENTLLRESLAPGQTLQDQLVIELGRIALIHFERDVSGEFAQVIKGGIGIGLGPGESVPMREEGVVANINFAQLDMDAWEKVLSKAAGTQLAPAADVETASVVNNTSARANALALRYLPSVIAVRAQDLTVSGRTLHDVVVGGSRDGLTWRANLDARELSGYLEYRQPSGAGTGRVYARLTRLSLATAQANDIETALDEQPGNIPALDIVVDDLELRGKRLGRVEIEAINRSAAVVAREGGVREWRLNKLNVIMPEAQFTANGNWVALNAQRSSGTGLRPTLASSERRRTVMNFKLDIADAGLLLKRLGMDKLIAKGNGKMEGQVAWVGSPLALDYPSLAGSMNVNIENGQFLKADPGIAKLLGVLSLQALPRRLALDFRDVFTEGFSFDFIRGDVKIDQGVAFTNNLQMKGVNAAVLMEGRANIASETQDIKVVVVPELNAGTVSLIATVINPAVGIGTFLAQLILRRPMIQVATQEFHIDGAWADPKITKIERKSVPVVSDTENARPALPEIQ